MRGSKHKKNPKCKKEVGKFRIQMKVPESAGSAPLFLYYISYKRQRGPACVLARCGVQSTRILLVLSQVVAYLCRIVSLRK